MIINRIQAKKELIRFFLAVAVCFVFNWAAAQTATIIRGPYLQMGTETAVTIRWRTDVSTTGRITYGLATTSLTGVASETISATEHELRLTNLLPDQRYYYSIGTPNGILEQSAANYFQTNPPAATVRPIRIASFGDCGTPSTNQTNVQTGLLTYRGNVPTDLWILIGDNSYNGGDAEFQVNFFDPYRTTLLKNTMLMAIPGNHDYSDNSSFAASHAIPYFSIFTHPTQAELGGVASGTREWYSFDYGPVHFIMLDGYGTRSINGVQTKLYNDTLNHPQAIWLKQDLAANTKKWTIAYLHFPPYTQGSHNSETESDLIAVRQRINPILERFGVDILMTGHSHVYERSYPIHDQRGPMSDFAANPSAYRYPADASSGRYDGTVNSCPYRRSSAKQKQSTLYVVSGSAGQLGSIPSLGNHPVMAFTQKMVGGSFYMDVQENRLDARFIQADAPTYAVVTDQFTMMKDVGVTRSLTTTAGQSTTLTASFISDYQWSSPNSNTFSAQTREIVVFPSAVGSQTFVVTDSRQCVRDTFTVQADRGQLSSLKPGNWTDPNIWSGNRVPTRFDIVQLNHPVTIPANVQATATQLQYAPNVRLFYGQHATLTTDF